jgi:hypothetical protein
LTTQPSQTYNGITNKLTGVNVKYEIGKTVKQHADYVTSDDCFVCGKELKATGLEIKIALTENQTLSTLDEISSTFYQTDYSPRVGTDCMKKFPKESLFTQNESGAIYTYA